MDTDMASTLLINTVADKKTKYTIWDYSCAILAHKLIQIMGCPNTWAYIQIVEQNLIPNCPITRQYIMAANFLAWTLEP